MKDIAKLIRDLRKKAEASLGFNLHRSHGKKIKKADDQLGDSVPQEPMDQGVGSTPPTQAPVVTPPAPSPSPSISVRRSDFDQDVENFVDENRHAIPQLGQYMLQTAEAMKITDPAARNEAMGSIPLTVDINLYNLLTNDQNHKEYQTQFINIANRKLSLAPGNSVSSFLMALLVAKAKAFLEDPEVVKWNRQNESAFQQIEEGEQTGGVIGDGGLAELTKQSFDPRKLTRDQIHAFALATGKDWSKMPLSWIENAALKRLTAPKDPSLTDQRMNFFIKNPNYLQSLIYVEDEKGDAYKDDMGNPFETEFAEFLREKLSQMQGVDPHAEIPAQIRQADEGYVGEDGKRHRHTRELSHVLLSKAQELFEILQGLISKQSPDIARWIKNGLNGARSRELSTDNPMGSSEGATFGDLISDRSIQSRDLVISALNPAQQAEVSAQIAALLQGYFADTVNDMELLREQTVAKMRTDSLSMIKAKASSADVADVERSKALKLYGKAEKLNAYTLAAIEQMRKILSATARPPAEDPNTVIYANEFGELRIPKAALLEIFGGSDYSLQEMLKPKSSEERMAQISQYIQWVDNGKVQAPLVPDWGRTTNTNLIAAAYKELAACKRAVFAVTKDKGWIPSTPDDYRGVVEQLPPQIKEKIGKLSDGDVDGFIYATLQQDPSKIRYFYPIQEQDPQKRRAEENRLKHSLKVEVGEMWGDLLPYVNRIMEGSDQQKILPFVPQSIKGFVKLFEHRKDIREFGMKGRGKTDTGEHYTDVYRQVTKDEAQVAQILRDMHSRGREAKVPKSENTYLQFLEKYTGYKQRLDALEARQIRYDRYEGIVKDRANTYLKQSLKLLESLQEMEPEARRSKLKDLYEQNIGGLPRPQKNASQKEKEDYAGAHKFQNFVHAVESWAGETFENYYFYRLLGKAKAIAGIYKAQKELEHIKTTGKNDKVTNYSMERLKQETDRMKPELQQMAEALGLSPENRKALTLAYVYYRKMKYALQRLQMIKSSMAKFASTSATIDVIEQRMANVRAYYVDKINSLMG